MEKTILGIIIPTLGYGKYLKESLTSVLKVVEQVDAVVVIVTPKNELGNELPIFSGRIHFVEDLEPAGLYPAINAGMRFLEENYEWRYFTYLNDDDLLLPGFTAMMKTLEHQPITDIAYGQCEFVVEGSDIVGVFSLENKPKRVTSLFIRNIVGIQQPGTVTSKRMWKSCGPFDVSFKLCADMKYFFSVLDLAATFHVSGYTVSRFRIQRHQLSSDRKSVEDENKRIRETILNGRSLGILGFVWILLFRIKNVFRIHSSLLRMRTMRDFGK